MVSLTKVCLLILLAVVYCQTSEAAFKKTGFFSKVRKVATKVGLYFKIARGFATGFSDALDLPVNQELAGDLAFCTSLGEEASGIAVLKCKDIAAASVDRFLQRTLSIDRKMTVLDPACGRYAMCFLCSPKDINRQRECAAELDQQVMQLCNGLQPEALAKACLKDTATFRISLKASAIFGSAVVLKDGKGIRDPVDPAVCERPGAEVCLPPGTKAPTPEGYETTTPY